MVSCCQCGGAPGSAVVCRWSEQIGYHDDSSDFALTPWLAMIGCKSVGWCLLLVKERLDKAIHSTWYVYVCCQEVIFLKFGAN